MRSNQRPPGLSRTGRFRPLTEVPHGGARAEGTGRGIEEVLANPTRAVGVARHRFGERQRGALALDRKSTRLNSSHGYISYAVFCLKKKKLEPARRIYSDRKQ